MTVRRLVLWLFLLTGALVALTAETRFVIQTGHSGEVRSVRRQDSTGKLVSVGADGTLKVWNERRLLYNRQISHLPLTEVRLHPTAPVAAFIATDNINTYRLIVYNWAENRELFSLRIDELPLELGFSPRGSYLYYSRTEINSLSLLDAESGAAIDIARNGFGIVSAAFISDTESTMVCYLPSGGILYWDMREDRRKAAPISTTSNLELVGFNGSGRYGIGYRSGVIYLFDLVTGRNLDTIKLDGVVDIAVHPNENSIAVIRNTPRLQEIRLYNFNSLKIVETLRASVPQARPLSVSYDRRGVTLGLANGLVGRLNTTDSSFVSWVAESLIPVSDIDLWNGSLVLSGPGNLFLMDSPALQGTAPAAPDSLEQTVLPLPFSSGAGFLALDPRRSVLWSVEAAENAYLFSVTTGRFEPLFPIAAACEEIYADGNRLLSLDRNGSIFLYDLGEEQLKYRYAASGIRDVTFIDTETIIAGRNPSDRFPSPLMRINLRTGETVPLNAADLLIFSLRYDPVTMSLYTLGLQDRRGRIMTVLTQLQGENFQRRSPLLSFPGEDHSSTFVLDSLRIYTSLGHSGVQVSGWDGFSDLDSVEHIPRKIGIHQGLLASLNSDSSVSLWNRRSGSWLGTSICSRTGNGSCCATTGGYSPPRTDLRI